MKESPPPSQTTQTFNSTDSYRNEVYNIEDLILRAYSHIGNFSQAIPPRFTGDISDYYVSNGPAIRPEESKQPKEDTKAPEKTLLIKDLTPKQKSALNCIERLKGSNCDLELISESWLKTNYRRLALRLHPDRNVETSSVEGFRALTEAYRELLKAFKSC